MSKIVSGVELRILTVPTDTAVLRSKSQPIQKTDKELIEFLKDLGGALRAKRKPQGVGLSAVQVGKTIRAFATLLPEEVRKEGSQKSELLFYINPEIIEHSKDMTLGEDINPYNEDLEPGETPKPFLEGCLSIPHVYGPVKRWTWIKSKAIVLREADLVLPFTPSPLLFTLEKLSARVFQHEIDHLNGVLFTDRTIAEGNQLYREINKELEPVGF